MPVKHVHKSLASEYKQKNILLYKLFFKRNTNEKTKNNPF